MPNSIPKEFANSFWAFIKAGNYQNQQRSTDKKIFYRFNEPEDKSYPFMLELFSRTPDTLVLGDDSDLTPIPVDEDVDSLSAILLDEDYYEFIHQHKVEIDDVPVVTPECLIPLKAKAWLDLTTRKDAGDKVDSNNIKKHKNDIFRLFQIISPELRVDLPGNISQDLQQYFNAISEDKDLPLKDFGLNGLGVLDVIGTLREVYKIPGKLGTEG